MHPSPGLVARCTGGGWRLYAGGGWRLYAGGGWRLYAGGGWNVEANLSNWGRSRSQSASLVW
ncbi:MAG: hypothetical protein QOJ69_1945 [Actinomycetota bacterium]|nr:hypothetical protein [Actinomycetota bacterium]